MNYHINTNGAAAGPFSEEELQAKIRSGEIAATTNCWADGWAQWRPLGEVCPQWFQSPPPPPPPALPQYTPAPAHGGFTCPFCKHQGLPIRTKKVSSSGWIVFILLILFCIPLCWLPFVIDGLQEEERKCSQCGARLG